jgi:hypothetical protein
VIISVQDVKVTRGFEGTVIMYQVEDKVCLVTGAASGIGAGVVRAFLNEGGKVSINLYNANQEPLNKNGKFSFLCCPGHNKRIAPLSFLNGCRKRLLKD